MTKTITRLTATTPHFNALFEQSRNASPTYQGRLANHLPMTLVALHRLGASDQTLSRFFEHYRGKLEPLSVEKNSTSPNSCNNTEQRLFEALNYFRKALSTHNRSTVLQQHLYELAEGICASAFHCLIRLGYALTLNDNEELALTLAFFATEYQSLGQLNEPDQAEQTLEFREIIAYIQQQPSLAEQTVSAPNIIVRLDRVAALDDFGHVIEKMKTCHPSLSTLTQFSRDLFYSTANFTALHCLTGCHALRRVLYQLNDDRLASQLIRYMAVSIAAVYISIKTPLVQDLSIADFAQPIVDQEALTVNALQSLDEHVIKVTHSCFDEFQHYNDPIFLHCAKQYQDRHS